MGAFTRRAISIPAVVVAFALLCATAPAVLLGTLAFDLAKRTRFGATRLWAMFFSYLGCEALGVAVIGVYAVLRALRVPGDVMRNHRLQWWWAGTLFRAARAIFELGLEVHGEAALAPGPVLILMRHASVADTLIPAALMSAPRRMRMRYVLKHELLWDPCLDIVGNRIPNAFVKRGSDQAEREIAMVRALGQDLAPDEGVLVYPEGTRFSPTNRERALAKVREALPALAERAAALTHVLPPRLGGALALLEGGATDVVFCAHSGLEAVRKMSDLWNGRVVKSHVRVSFWRVPAREIPRERAAQIDWLYAQWQRMDTEVAKGMP